MSGEPITKRARVDDEVKDPIKNNHIAQKSLQELDKVQGELDLINQAASAEIIEIEKKYNKIREPHYQDRQKLTEKIPNFWLTVFVNHPIISRYLLEDEEEALHYLTKLEVFEEFKEGVSTYKLNFTFDINPFFSNSELFKQVVASPNKEAETICSKIDWKPNKDLTANKQDGTQTFFSWLTDCSDPQNDELSDIIKDDIWLNPIQYFLMPDLSETVEDGDLLSDEENDDLVE